MNESLKNYKTVKKKTDWGTIYHEPTFYSLEFKDLEEGVIYEGEDGIDYVVFIGVLFVTDGSMLIPMDGYSMGLACDQNFRKSNKELLED